MHHTKDYALEWTFVFPFALLQLDQDGTVHFGDPIGGLHQVFGLKAKVQGQFQDKRNKSSHSLCGEGTFVHQYQETSPHKIANRWQFINFVSPHLSMVTISGLTPKALHQETFGTLALHYLDPITQTYHSAVSSHIEYSFLNTLKDTPTNYLVPQQLEVQAHLTNDNGEPLLLTLHFANLNFNQVFRVNVLNELPWLVRKAIQLLFANPVVYQFLEQVSLKLQKKDSNVILAEVSGSAIFELTYTNEV
ncbi:putative cell survival pathways protein [Coelomomyces lativittatus]|nr:putative cell survival pathways protein [Coelomomyces lativittatus]